MTDCELFVFDCPSKWCVLSYRDNHPYSDDIDPWFLIDHLQSENVKEVTPEDYNFNSVSNNQDENALNTRNIISKEQMNNNFRLSSANSKQKLLAKQNTNTNALQSAKRPLISSSLSNVSLSKHDSNSSNNVYAKRSILQSKDNEQGPVKKVKQTINSNTIASTSIIKTKSVISTNNTTANVTKKSKPIVGGGMLKGLDSDMVEILRRHNDRFAPTPVYEPALHGMREVRRWEKATGKIWSQLSIEEKEIANQEIATYKR